MISLHEGLQQGRLKDGDLMVAIAAGISHASGVNTITKRRILIATPIRNGIRK